MAVRPVYDEVFGITGLETPDGTWQFYQKSGFFSLKRRSGGWEFRNEKPSDDVNNRFCKFYSEVFPYNPVNKHILFHEEDAHDKDGFKKPVRMYHFYFGIPAADGDYPKGALSDRILDESKGTDAQIVKLVLDDKNQPTWIPITVRDEDIRYLRTGRRQLNAGKAAAYGAFAPRAPIFSGGSARKTKARRAVKKRRTARRTRQ